MPVVRLRSTLVLLAATVGMGGCAYNPYAGTGVSVGIGNAGYYDPYYSGYGSQYGYGYGSPYGYGYGYSPYGYGAGYGYSPYYGWHNGYYYPGTGYYVYDRDRRRRTLTPAERAYWEQRASQPGTTTTRKLLDNWSGYAQGTQSGVQSTQGTRSVATTRSVRTTRSVPDSGRTFRVRRSEEVRERAISRQERAATRDLNSENKED